MTVIGEFCRMLRSVIMSVSGTLYRTLRCLTDILIHFNRPPDGDMISLSFE
jgi:hypothetical protein